jgi:uncharacterized CHY-type Zn-finger protein
MGLFKWMMEQSRKDEQKLIAAAMAAEMVKEEYKKMHTCKVCKRIFTEGIPYQYTMFGKPKSYVCTTCAKNMGLTS